ncbi:MAG: hypothetical protein RI911_80, partial [Candidatus Parcubacteria bacterium]|jgi:hypothetical protein
MVRHAGSIYALEEINLVTALFPIIWASANCAFFVFLLWGRSRGANPPSFAQGEAAQVQSAPTSVVQE